VDATAHPVSIPGVVSSKELEGSALELLAEYWPTARVLVVDINADEEWLLTRIANLLKRERQAAALPTPDPGVPDDEVNIPPDIPAEEDEEEDEEEEGDDEVEA
jgi:hypothetical protein